MRVPDDVRKCVVFVGAKRADGNHQMLGSAFFLGRNKAGEDKVDPCYIVTAKHVVDKARSLGVQHLGLRMNRRDGGVEWLEIPADDWMFDSTDSSVDVAVREQGIPSQFDHLAIPTSMGVTPTIISENEVGPGDEVFITGLFRHHHGANRNIPIIRVGSLACMGEEKVSTSFGDMDALLIEARSIGGLSGSPIFLHLGPARPNKGQVDFNSKFFLLGLVHGHYDANEQGVDAFEGAESDDTTRLTNAQINTGIAIAVPYHSIEAILDARETWRAQLLNAPGVLTYDLPKE